MTVLHCSDLHAQKTKLDWLVRESDCYDLVCITGDFLDDHRDLSAREQSEATATALMKIRVPLAICSGNHDSPPRHPQLRQARWLRDLRNSRIWVDGDRFDFGDFHFRCMPWDGALPPATTGNEIWLIHAPPDRCATATVSGKGDFGDFTFGQLCRMNQGPALALSGHIHAPDAWHARSGRTVSINAGCAADETSPRAVEIFLDERLVRFANEQIEF